MDKEYQDQYYDLTPDAEDIDKVLTDLVDILNKKENSGWFVKYVVEDEPHFELGEGSGGSTYIPGEGDQLVAADGEGKAKANIGEWFSEKSGNGMGVLRTTSPNFIFKGSEDSKTTQSYWGNKRYSSYVLIERGSLLQMLSGSNGSPVLSLSDSAIVEIGGERTTYGQQLLHGQRQNPGNWTADLTQQVYEDYYSPIDNSKKLKTDGVIYPYLHMGQSATLIMEGASLIKTGDGAAMELSGRSQLKISNSFSSKTGTYDTSAPLTDIEFNRGAWVKMDTEDPGFRPLFLIERQSETLSHLLMSTSWTGEWTTLYPSPAILNNSFRSSRLLSLGRASEMSPNLERDYLGFTPKAGINSESASLLSTQIKGTTVMIEGKTNIRIGDNGYLFAKMGTRGYTTIDWTDNINTDVDIKIGAGRNSAVVIDFGTAETNSGWTNAYYKICPEAQSNTVFSYTPAGNSSIQYAPTNSCFIGFTPKNTEISCQWQKLDAIIQGTDGFLQTGGNWHHENHSGIFILRSSKYTYEPSTTNISGKSDRVAWNDSLAPDLNSGQFGISWYAPLYLNRPNVLEDPVFQMYDGSNFCMAGFTTIAPTLTDKRMIRTFGNNNPIFEMLGPSDIHMYNGASFTMETDNASTPTTKLTFKSNRSAEEEVTFLLSELKELKEILDKNINFDKLNLLLEDDNFNKLIQLISEE